MHTPKCLSSALWSRASIICSTCTIKLITPLACISINVKLYHPSLSRKLKLSTLLCAPLPHTARAWQTHGPQEALDPTCHCLSLAGAPCIALLITLLSLAPVLLYFLLPSTPKTSTNLSLSHLPLPSLPLSCPHWVPGIHLPLASFVLHLHCPISFLPGPFLPRPASPSFPLPKCMPTNPHEQAPSASMMN